MSSMVKPPCDEGVIRSGAAAAPCSQSAGRWVLAATVLGSSMAFIDSTVVNVALPVMQTDLNATIAGAQWIVEAYALLLAALLLTGGALGDQFGRRRVFGLGVALFAATSTWCALAPSVHQLICARAVQGIAAALLVPGSLAMLSASFDDEHRGRAIGTWSGLGALSTGIGPVLGGWLVQHASWRWAFTINVPIACAVLAILRWRVPADSLAGRAAAEVRGGAEPAANAPQPARAAGKAAARAPLDIIGTVLGTIGLGAVVYALVESSIAGFAHAMVIAAFAAGIAALIGFVLWEARAAAPMMPLSLFRSRTFSGANLLTLFLYAALSGALFFLPFNLVQVQGYSPSAAGASLVPFIVVMFCLSRWSGGLVRRYGSRLPLTIGPLIAAAGFVLLAWPGIGGSYWVTFFPGVVVLSLGMAIAVAPLTTTVMSAISSERAGIASGVNNAASRVAGVLAIAVLSIVMVQTFGRHLDRSLAGLRISGQVRQEIDAERSKLAGAQLPVGLPDEETRAIRGAIASAFVAGFRNVMLMAAALALAGAASGWVLIRSSATRRA
jgi:MFS family permease